MHGKNLLLILLSFTAAFLFLFSIYIGNSEGYIITVTFVYQVAMAMGLCVFFLILISPFLFLIPRVRILSFYFSLIVIFTLSFLIVTAAFDYQGFKFYFNLFTISLLLSLSAQTWPVE